MKRSIFLDIMSNKQKIVYHKFDCMKKTKIFYMYINKKTVVTKGYLCTKFVT